MSMPVGRRELIASFTSQLRGAQVDVVSALAEAVLVELEPGCRERVGLHNVGARLKIRLVNIAHDVWSREHECLVAAEIFRAAEILRREIERHELRAHGSIEDQNALAQQAQILRH
jgi:hypothetical protein